MVTICGKLGKLMQITPHMTAVGAKDVGAVNLHLITSIRVYAVVGITADLVTLFKAHRAQTEFAGRTLSQCEPKRNPAPTTTRSAL